jgi:sugar phosphate isomerase/epimerase
MAQDKPLAFGGQLKGRFPFRLGATSYVRRDALLPNVRLVAKCVDDIELVLFEMTDLPDASVIEELCAIAEQDAVSYTVHLPLDLRLGSCGEPERERSVCSCAQIASLSAPLKPVAYIVHLNEEPGSGEENTQTWLGALDRSIGELLDTGIASRDLCVETLSYPLAEVEGVIESRDLSVCIDVGHLLTNDLPIDECVDEFGVRTRVMHLHGVADGRDHRDIGHLSAPLLSTLLARIDSSWPALDVLTLEVFRESDLISSLSIMEGFLK